MIINYLINPILYYIIFFKEYKSQFYNKQKVWNKMRPFRLYEIHNLNFLQATKSVLGKFFASSAILKIKRAKTNRSILNQIAKN